MVAWTGRSAIRIADGVGIVWITILALISEVRNRTKFEMWNLCFFLDIMALQ